MDATLAGHHCSGAPPEQPYCSRSTLSAAADRANITPCGGQSLHLRTLPLDAFLSSFCVPYAVGVLVAGHSRAAAQLRQCPQSALRRPRAPLSLLEVRRLACACQGKK
mmetsp:Transcript_18568/g.57058  ORF Transcript_18568/g.57058 Transcript_18568/m.57058 type:complete len:108 (+) Transcript_18568:117-440(+)